MRIDERTGGNGRLSTDSIAFGEWISELALIDMGFCGNKYTWKRGCMESTFVSKRLDRILCCAHTRLKWQEPVVSHLPFFSSNHAPLYLQLCPVTGSDPRQRPFRFEAAWLNHSGFKDLLTASWDGNLKTPEALNGLRIKLKQWNKEVFGDVQRRKEKLMVEIKTVQEVLEHNQTDALLAKEAELIKEFDVLLEQEELIWFQKSREKWVVTGDRNTKFFHTSTIIRRRRNRIEMLKNDEDVWISEATQLEKLAVEYYSRLYSLADVDPVAPKLPQVGFVKLSSDELTALCKPFSAAEVETSVRSMGKFKAPGPDGFQPVFYQQCSDIVGDSVVGFVLDFFETGILPSQTSQTNDALVVLIAKVLKPEKIT